MEIFKRLVGSPRKSCSQTLFLEWRVANTFLSLYKLCMNSSRDLKLHGYINKIFFYYIKKNIIKINYIFRNFGRVMIHNTALTKAFVKDISEVQSRILKKVKVFYSLKLVSFLFYLFIFLFYSLICLFLKQMF